MNEICPVPLGQPLRLVDSVRLNHVPPSAASAQSLKLTAIEAFVVKDAAVGARVSPAFF
jgi:hypothetical protein